MSHDRAPRKAPSHHGTIALFASCAFAMAPVASAAFSLRLSKVLDSVNGPPRKDGATVNGPAAQSTAQMRLKTSPVLSDAPSPKARTAPIRPFPEVTQPIVVEIKVNAVNRGEAIVQQTADGRFLLRESDLGDSLRLPELVERFEIDGESHVLASDIRGAKVVLDEKTLVLDVTLPAGVFPGRVVDLSTRPLAVDFEATPRSAHLNYRLGHFRTNGQGNGTISLATEGVVSMGAAQLRNLSTHSRSDDETISRRVETQLSWENRSNLTRLTFGDATTPGLALGGAVPLGGITFAKAFAMDPYVIRYPSAGFRGLAEFPSQVDFLVGNTVVSRQRVEPGPFEIRNFNYYGGQRDVRVVVRDIFGREQVITYPFYFADQGLAKGLQDFSYQVGAVRKNLADSSNDYGEAMYSAYHRIGLTDSWTVGFRAEGKRGLFNAGPEAVFRHELAGVFSASVAASRSTEDDTSGEAVALAHTFQFGDFSTGLFYQRRSDSFRTLASVSSARLPSLDFGASVGYSKPRFGSVNLAFAQQEQPEKGETRSVGISYSLPVFGRGTLLALYRRDLGEDKGYNATVTLNLPFDAEHQVGLSHSQDSSGRRTDQIQLSRAQQQAAGLSYSLNLQDQTDDSGRTRSVNPRVEWGTRYATLFAEALTMRGSGAESHDVSTYNLAVAGALVAAGGHFAATRPIDDSFAVVQITPPIAGVRVRANGQDQDVTDAHGRVLLPNVTSYAGTNVKINDKDIPIEYAIDSYERTFSAPQRSGTVVEFLARKVQGFTGIFNYHADGQKLPLKNTLVVVDVGGKPIEVFTSSKGDFYVENFPPGTHRASSTVEGQKCIFDLVIPKSEELIVTLNEISTCTLGR